MNAVEPDRRIGVAANRDGLRALEFSCVRLMEIAAGILVRIDETAEKIILSREVWALAQAAQRLRDRIGSLRTLDCGPHPASTGYADLANEIISLQNPVTELSALVQLCYPDLRAAVSTHMTRLVSMADEATAACLNAVCQDLTVLRSDSSPLRHCLGPLAALLIRCGGALGPAPAEPGTAQGAEPILQRSAMMLVPVRPGREARLTEATAHRPAQANAPRRSYADVLHDFAFRIELCAAEVCAAMIAHYPDSPWGLRLDLAKQTRDEARHFELFTERVGVLGERLGSYPIAFEVWDKFRIGRTLSERLVIQQRLGEGVALDSVENVARRLRLDGELDVALAFDYITADEVTHVANGNKWLRVLLGDDEAVREAEDVARRLLAENGMATPYKSAINVQYRRLGGFTEVDLDRLQVLQAEFRGQAGAEPTAGQSESGG